MTTRHRLAPEPFHSARRMALVALAWLALAIVHSLLLGVAEHRLGAVGQAALFYVPRALAWALLTPMIASVDARLRIRRPAVPAMLAGHLAALGAVGLADTVARRAILAAFGSASMVPWQATLLYYAD